MERLHRALSNFRLQFRSRATFRSMIKNEKNETNYTRIIWRHLLILTTLRHPIYFNELLVTILTMLLAEDNK